MRNVKSIVVTGGLGFIGSNFIETALKKGWKVTNIDKKTYAANDINFGNSPNYSLIVEDIKDVKSIPDCDMIINFAAESHVDNSIDESDVFLNSNIIGVHNLLNIIMKQIQSNYLHGWNYKVPIFFQVSTDEVFGDIAEGFFKTTDPLIPSNPYSATKASAEMLVMAWGRTYKIPYLISRTTNNYGERQHSEKLIPNTITSLLTGKKVPIHGNGKHIRNWIHVKDNVKALISIIEKGDLNSFYHIASKEEYNVVEVVEKIASIMGKDFKSSVEFTSDRSGADVRYALDTTKTDKLGWKPKITFEAGISNLIDHYSKGIKNGGEK
jgi:dTDP-glucose 4,6-dehydratase